MLKKVTVEKIKRAELEAYHRLVELRRTNMLSSSLQDRLVWEKQEAYRNGMLTIIEILEETENFKLEE